MLVQRLPVRIVLDSSQLKQHPLRVGLSMHAQIDVRDTSGPLIANQVRKSAQPTQASAADDPQIEQRIAEIIRNNSSTTGALARNRGAALNLQGERQAAARLAPSVKGMQ